MARDESLEALGLESGASRGDLLAAVERLIIRYHNEARSSDVARPGYRGSTLPSPGATLSVICLLHEAGRVGEARRLENAFAAWLGAPRETEALGSSARLWQWVRDLGALSDTLSPEIRRTLAHASRIGNLDVARVRLRAFAVVDRRLRRDADLLRESGGSFVGHADYLVPTDAIPSASRTLASGRGAVALGGAAVAFLVGIAYNGGSSDRSARRALVPPIAVADPQEEAIEAVARLRGSLGDGPQSQQARALSRALSEHDCGAALEQVNALMSRGPHPETRGLLEAMASAVGRACSKTPSPRPSAARDAGGAR